MKSPIYIVGGGHAGIEAAFAISRVGLKSVIVTMDAEATGRMSCNPAIGGLAKSHLVHEIDALGGIMSIAADFSGVQFKTLNISKGRAVQSLRIQTDKKKYPKFVKSVLDKEENIKVIEGEVVSFNVNKGAVSSLVLRSGEKINCSALIITSGTFLNGLIHIGNRSFRAGRIGESASKGLTESLRSFGFDTSRLKTGTPPRILKKSIDWGLVNSTPGDANPSPFSLFRTNSAIKTNIDSFSVNTNPSSHNVLLDNLESSPMFSGKIDAAGPRYCPSIEDKVVRFSSQNSHSLFLESEWAGSDQIYLGGFSTSMPEEVQISCLKTIKAFKNVEFIRPGYAIEYDFIPTYQLKSTLESKEIDNLYCAGQINGTSGYEEAAAQGLMAGANAALKILNKKPFVIKRNEGYIGVLIDDLVTKSINEPYRMFTSRAEYRLTLRADNADVRLTDKGISLGLISNERKLHFRDKTSNLEKVRKKMGILKISPSKVENYGIKIAKDGVYRTANEILSQKGVNMNNIREIWPEIPKNSKEIDESLEIEAHYKGYLTKQSADILAFKKDENLKIPKNIDYEALSGLSNEVKSKFKKIKPQTMGQALRIDGITPAAVYILLSHVKRKSINRIA